MNPTEELKQLVFQYFKGSLATENEATLFRYIQDSKANLARFRVWEQEWIEQAQTDPDIDTEWKKFTTRQPLCNEMPTRHKTLLPSWWKKAIAVAALVAGVIVATLFVDNQVKQITTPALVSVEAPYGEKSKITLSDGTVVWLNSGSKLTYAAIPEGNRHEVILTGEGYFEVSKNKARTFVVKTQTYAIEVIGTKFNVTAYPDDRFTTTTLIEGKINLLHEGRKNALHPGQSVAYDTRTRQFEKADISLQAANTWIHNDIIYDNITLRELSVKLSRQYNVAIQLESDELGDKKFNIAMRNDESLTEVMHAIEKVMNVEVNSIGNNYYLRKKQ